MAGNKKMISTLSAGTASGHAPDHDAIPSHAMEDISRIVFRETRIFFSNPAVQEDYKQWLAEYQKKRQTKGREIC